MSSRISKLTIFIVKDHMSEINKCHYKEIGWYCRLSQRGYYTWLIEWLLLNLQRTAAFQDENKFSISGREQVQYFRTRTSSVLQDENKFSISGREQVQYFRTRTSSVMLKKLYKNEVNESMESWVELIGLLRAGRETLSEHVTHYGPLRGFPYYITWHHTHPPVRHPRTSRKTR